MPMIVDFPSDANDKGNELDDQVKPKKSPTGTLVYVRFNTIGGIAECRKARGRCPYGFFEIHLDDDGNLMPEGSDAAGP